MEINFSSRECNVKIVYYGPGLSGKTTNLEVIHAKTPTINRGKLTALATDLDRTLYFDYMPLELGKISGLTVRMRLFTVPGQVYYNSTRKLVLRCADGIVFVADSQKDQRDANAESLLNLKENLLEHGLYINDIPIILQLNKRDLPNLMSLEAMETDLNSYLPSPAPCIPAVAPQGNGVFQCLKAIANLSMGKVEETIARSRSNHRETQVTSTTAVIKEKELTSPEKLSFIPPKKKMQTSPSKKKLHFSLTGRQKPVKQDTTPAKPDKESIAGVRSQIPVDFRKKIVFPIPHEGKQKENGERASTAMPKMHIMPPTSISQASDNNSRASFSHHRKVHTSTTKRIGLASLPHIKGSSSPAKESTKKTGIGFSSFSFPSAAKSMPKKEGKFPVPLFQGTLRDSNQKKERKNSSRFSGTEQGEVEK